jgi:hypothetical protein
VSNTNLSFKDGQINWYIYLAISLKPFLKAVIKYLHVQVKSIDHAPVIRTYYKLMRDIYSKEILKYITEYKIQNSLFLI